jgi:hypothetical protein
VNDNNTKNRGTRESRETLNVFLENILHATGNYNGYRYLTSLDLPEGVEPGIIFAKSGYNDHEFPDITRIQYFYKSE